MKTLKFVLLIAVILGTGCSNTSPFPTVEITYPTMITFIPSPEITVTGNAFITTEPQIIDYEKLYITRVEVSLNKGEWQKAEGSSKWSIDLTLEEGINRIEARAVTETGEISSIFTVICHYNKLGQHETVLVEGGVFSMGARTIDSEWAYEDEYPVHEVQLDDFYIGKYEVQQSEFYTLMGYNPSSFIGTSYPAEHVSWLEAVEFCSRLSIYEELEPYYVVNGETDPDNWGSYISSSDIGFVEGSKGYRLPTEAEWEYAAKGGQSSGGYLYSGGNNLDEVGWYLENSYGSTGYVGNSVLQPNELGIYDMSGNVWEWCWDWYSDSYYQECYDSGTVENPIGPESGSLRIARGGAWGDNHDDCRVTLRYCLAPAYGGNFIGFRVVRSK